MLFLENEVLIPIKHSSNDIKLPQKMYSDSAGYDLLVSESVKLSAWGRALVCVELQMSIPKDYFGNILLRSGLATHHGIVAFQGTVDSGYKGIIYALLFNFSDKDYVVEKGNGIVQIIFLKCQNYVSFLEYETLDFNSSERGSKGFGSILGY